MSQIEIKDNHISAVVLYEEGDSWKEIVNWLEQSTLLGLNIQAKKISEKPELSEYEVIYLDESLLERQNKKLAEDIMEYTYQGGNVFVPNGFYDYFPEEYFGASGFQKIEAFPAEAEFPECGKNMGNLQQITEDFLFLYKDYMDAETLVNKDYGWGLIAKNAVSLAEIDGVSLYALNTYGNGNVLFVNPLLPNAYSLGSYSMGNSQENMTAFASTTASFNQLLLSEFAAYAAKEDQGYALKRVYGYFGTPSMSWEFHYEELTGIANEALQICSKLCEEANQIPSFTLIRNSYIWSLRAESVTYLLNQSEEKYSKDHYKFEMDYYESAYSSGTHIDSGGKWLSQEWIEDGGSYFNDYPEYTCRAYPYVIDYDKDGILDLICGSSNGDVYYYSGIEFTDGRWKVSEAKQFKDQSGVPISITSNSAPQMADMDGDDRLDLICGYGDGCVRWFRGNDSLEFENQGIILNSGISGQVLPAVGDLNGDGITDMVLGSDQGILRVYEGVLDENGRIAYSDEHVEELSEVCRSSEIGDWLAPGVTDWNGDGVQEIAVGTFDGYIAVLKKTLSGYSFDSYITIKEQNYKGNHNLKFGNYAVPVFADLDNDGNYDLVCGSQEYGLAYPVDSEYFMHQKELLEQVQYVKDHDYYMGVHFYTNQYASEERELYELEAHKKVMEFFGLPVETTGVNQHTWYTSTLSGNQTMRDIYKAGFLWESGFSAPGASENNPYMAAENAVALPFYLVEDGKWTTLVQNHSVVPHMEDECIEISARYRVPVPMFYHCEFVYQSDEAVREYIRRASEFQKKYGYNFNREDQMMFASAAAIYQEIAVEGSPLTEKGLKLKEEESSYRYALYDEGVSGSLGVRIELSEDMNADDFMIDADIWYTDGNTLTVGLNREICIVKKQSPHSSDTHLRRVNMAADIQSDEDGMTVTFLSGGMMQASVQGKAVTDSDGWDVSEENGQTIFTKFGSNEQLHLIFKTD